MSRRIEELNPSHDRLGFDCGTQPLNRFLQQVARQHSERCISRTYVLVDEGAVEPKPTLPSNPHTLFLMRDDVTKAVAATKVR